MPDPKKFKPYYIISAVSKKANKIREQRLATEMDRMKKPSSLIEAKERAKNFAASLNESNVLNVNDWKPALYFQHSETQKLPVEV
jgi:hypothetical protein